MQPVYKVAICGGGNLAHSSIATIGHNNPQFKISLLTRRPEIWQNEITAYTKGSSWEYKGDLKGKLHTISSNAKDVVSDADIVIICSPAHTKNDILKQIKPHVKQGAFVGTLFGQGAFDLQAKSILGDELIARKNLTIFSLQYVPFICKAVNYGKDINIIGPKKNLFVASYPIEKVHEVCNLVTLCYYIPAIPIKSFLNLTLCPSNQIIHPGRVTAFFSRFPEQCHKVLKFKDVPLLYEDLDDASAQEMQDLDDEIQLIKKAILKQYPALNLDQVMPMGERVCLMYKGQVSDTSSLKRIFNTNIGYSRVPFPMLPVPGQDLKNTPKGDVKVKLNLNARFFWEDLPYGLCILKDIGNIVGVPTPAVTKNILFHQKFMPVKYVNEATGEFNQEVLKTTGAPSAYGITTIQGLVSTSMNSGRFAKL